MKTRLNMILILALVLIETNSLTAQTLFAPSVLAPYGLPTTFAGNSNPAFGDLDNDGDFDLLVGYSGGGFNYYENIGSSANPSFGPEQTNPFNLTNTGDYQAAPSIADMDGDGDLDVLSGSKDSGFVYFENIGTNLAPNYTTPVTNPFGLTTVNNSIPVLIDFDNDGDYDLFSGCLDGKTYYFENIGTANIPNFASAQQSPFGIGDVGLYSSPSFTDWDFDNDLDLIVAKQNGDVRCFQNTGTVSIPTYTYVGANQFGLENEIANGNPTLIDINNDGDNDLFFGSSDGRIRFQQFAPSYSTTNIQLCDGAVYTSPSTNYTWSTNGTYYDTIPNILGCDSMMTFDITAGNTTSSITNETFCSGNIYTSPSGNYIWSTSGIYYDTIPNVSGCDSLMTIILAEDTSVSCGLIRHYRLDGDPDDYSGNNEHGTVYGATIADRYGIANQCYRTISDNGDNITVPKLGDWGDNLVISMWFNPDSLNTSNPVSNIIFSRGSGGSYQNFFANIQHSDSTIRFLVASNSGHGQIYSSNKVNIGGWNHIVVYHDGFNNKLGVVLNSVTTEINWANTPRYKNVNIGLGNYNNNISPANGFNGRIDDVRFYNRQLPQQHIDSLGNPNNFPTSILEWEDELENSFFYPNPATDFMNFNKQMDEVRIYSISGQLVHNITNAKQVNIKSFIPGIYFVQAVSKGQIQSGKLIVQ